MPNRSRVEHVALGGDQELTYPYGNDKFPVQSPGDILVTSFVATRTRATVSTDGGPTLPWPDGRPAPHLDRRQEACERSKWGHADLGGNVIEFVMEVPEGRPRPPVTTAPSTRSYPDPPQNEPGPPTWKTKNPDGTELGRRDFGGEGGQRTASASRAAAPGWASTRALAPDEQGAPPGTRSGAPTGAPVTRCARHRSPDRCGDPPSQSARMTVENGLIERAVEDERADHQDCERPLAVGEARGRSAA